MVGTSSQMQRLYHQVQKAGQGTYPVVIRGETGTGKELVARSIHFAGAQRHRPFVPVDCPALSPGLFESELFGHLKGAFTGATHTTRGLMETANGGTLFLDEIGDLPLALQPKLLRTLQQNEVRPVGSNHAFSLDVRIISATNCDLELAIEHHTFRQDLFFRLNVVQLYVPALRERRIDIPLLAMHFLEKFSEAVSGWTISEEAMKYLTAYDWPGNVRELEHAIECAVAMSSESTIQVNDLPAGIGQTTIQGVMGHEVLNLQNQNRRAIAAALVQAHGDRVAAARILGIGKTTLYRKLKYDQSLRQHLHKSKVLLYPV